MSWYMRSLYLLQPTVTISAGERSAIENATVEFFSQVISCHPNNQRTFARVLRAVISLSSKCHVLGRAGAKDCVSAKACVRCERFPYTLHGKSRRDSVSKSQALSSVWDVMCLMYDCVKQQYIQKS
jgi:hypothetical protein